MTDPSAVAAALANVNVCVSDRSLLTRCTTMCAKYGIKPDDIASKWEVIAANGEASELNDDTIELLDQKFKAAQHKPSPRHPHQSKFSKKSTPNRRLSGGRSSNSPFLRSYGVNARTPPRPFPSLKKEHPTLNTSPLRSTPPKPRPTKVVCTFGDVEAIPSSKPVQATLGMVQMVGAYRHMSCSVTSKASSLGDRVARLGAIIVDRHKLEPSGTHDQYTQETIDAIGRVCCDSDGRLNAASVMLEASKDGSTDRVRLQLGGLEKYSIFPGQILGLRGNNPTGRAFCVSEMMDAAPQEKMNGGEALDGQGKGKRPRTDVMVGGGDKACTEGVHLIVAAGPYSPSSDMRYAPLSRILRLVVEERPNVLILCGPFVDERSAALVECTTDYHDLLQSAVLAPIKEALQNIASTGGRTDLVLVPSVWDVEHECVFPQPPLPESLVADALGGSSGFGVMRASNPCAISVDGLCIGACTADVLSDLNDVLLTRIDGRPAPREMQYSTLCSHLINQQSYYPIYPPGPDVPLDTTRYTALNMRYTPDILILPSNMPSFVTIADEETLCINPGVLRGDIATYASVRVSPMEKEAGEKITQRTSVVVKTL